MRSLVLTLLFALQVPVYTESIPPQPPNSVPEAREVLLGIRLVDVRPDGVYFIGSACPIGPFRAYTAAHVIKEIKGDLLALPTHGRRAKVQASYPVHAIWTDEKKDLALIAPDSGEQHFQHWYPLGPVPLVGAEARGTLMLPNDQQPAAPTFGTYYGENEGVHWTSLMFSPGSSGSCVLDSQDRAWGIATSLASWGNTALMSSHAGIVAELPSADKVKD